MFTVYAALFPTVMRADLQSLAKVRAKVKIECETKG